jgi:DNA-binding response OmpR family regulator
MRILLAEDERELANWLVRALQQSGFQVDWVDDGRMVRRCLKATRYDALVLDLGLPGVGGHDVLSELREADQRLPVLILTARDSLIERVSTLNEGADDFLAKPFELAELEARVRALLRRANATAQPDLVHGRLRLDVAGRRLYCDDRPLELSARELGVVELLLMKEGRVVTRQQIADQLYGWEDESTSNAIEVFIYRLRKKLEPSGVDIRTVRGMGYLIDRPHAA